MILYQLHSPDTESVLTLSVLTKSSHCTMLNVAAAMSNSVTMLVAQAMNFTQKEKFTLICASSKLPCLRSRRRRAASRFTILRLILERSEQVKVGLLMSPV